MRARSVPSAPRPHCTIETEVWHATARPRRRARRSAYGAVLHRVAVFLVRQLVRVQRGAEAPPGEERILARRRSELAQHVLDARETRRSRPRVFAPHGLEQRERAVAGVQLVGDREHRRSVRVVTALRVAGGSGEIARTAHRGVCLVAIDADLVAKTRQQHRRGQRGPLALGVRGEREVDISQLHRHWRTA